MVATLDFELAGTLCTTQTWSFGFHFKQIGTGGVGQADVDTWMAAAQPIVTTWANATLGFKALAGAAGTFQSIIGYYRPSPGAHAELVSRIDGLNLSGSTAQTLPCQCALVFSLRSANPSRAGRGRVYVPVTAQAMASPSGRLNIAVGTASLNLGTMLDSLNGIALGSNAVGLSTRTSQDLINRVTVDNVVDTQRRRRDQIAPSATGITVI